MADLNIDHRIVSQATLTAFRPLSSESWNEIRTFECHLQQIMVMKK